MVEYEHACIAVNAIILTIKNKELYVLLTKREKDPFKGKYELPGGLLKEKETAEEALQRKLFEIFGMKDLFFSQFKTFTDPDRDPRERTISIGYITLINEERAPHKNWYAVQQLPSLAFDHKEIITQAIAFLKNNMTSTLVKHFLPKKFPLNKLQAVHEAISGEPYDNRNFRKQMIAAGIVKETVEMEKEVSHRPAKLYQFVELYNNH